MACKKKFRKAVKKRGLIPPTVAPAAAAGPVLYGAAAIHQAWAPQEVEMLIAFGVNPSVKLGNCYSMQGIWNMSNLQKLLTLAEAAERLIQSQGELRKPLEDFRRDPEILDWLEDAAYFAAIDNSLNAFSWNEWPDHFKNRHLSALETIYQSQKDFIDMFIVQ